MPALLAILSFFRWLWRPRWRSLLSIHPAWRGTLRLTGLTAARDFLALPEQIVSGHPGRRVGRVTLGGKTFYLKREERVLLRSRLLNWLGGAGWSSLSLREAKTLEAMAREGVPAPQWVAVGEDSTGQAFLLVEAVPGESLPHGLHRADAAGKRRLMAVVGRSVARLHALGLCHRDLYAKHVLIDEGGTVRVVDWQRAYRPVSITTADRVRDLAALLATLPLELAGPRERLALLRAYLGGRAAPFARQVDAAVRQLLSRRHVREKRAAALSGGQEWACLDGRALCVTPALGAVPDWLRLEKMALPPGANVTRRWIELPDGRRCLLTRRRSRAGRRASPSDELRQANLLWRLVRHGVAGPRVLAAGERRAGRQVDSFLLVESPPCVRLEAWLVNKSPSARMRVWRQVGELMARLHEGCCYLGSLDAVAVTPTSEVVLSGCNDLIPRRRPDAARERQDLALLQIAGCRLQTDPPVEPPSASPAFRSAIGNPRSATPLTDGSTVMPTGFWGRWRTGAHHGRHRADWDDFAGPGWPDRIMDVQVTDRFTSKQGRSTGRWMLTTADGRRLVVYLKRHYRLGWWRGLLAALFPAGDWSPAMQEATNLQWAAEQGVPVPAVVAAGEVIGPDGALQSYLAVEELTGMMALNEALPLAQAKLSPADWERWKRGVVREMARLARLLHDRRRFHKDLYLCHYYVREEDLTRVPDDWRGRLSLIDLHRLGHHPWTWRRWQVKDLAQLLYSSEVPELTFRDRVAFWRAYRGPGTTSRTSRWLRRLVALKWARYRHHNLRHRPGGDAASETTGGQPS